MTKKQLVLRDWLNNVVLVVILCSLIAVATKMLWPGSYLMHLGISLTYGASAMGTVFLVSRLWPQLPMLQTNIVGVAGSMILGSLNLVNTVSNNYPGSDILNQMGAILTLSLLFNVFIFLFAYAHNRWLVAERSLQQAKVVQAELDKNLMLSQMKQLQSQMEPHFLFNTLASIDALIDSNPSLARRLLQRLNHLLRATLRGNSQALISLSDEVELFSAYLEIQQVRLGERLTYHIDYELGKLSPSELMLPPFLLQPLIENAIIHGVEPSSKKSHIGISFCLNSDQFIVRVQDDGIGLQADAAISGHGVGLANVRQRLLGLFCKDAQVNLYQISTGETVSELRLPLGKLEQLNVQGRQGVL